MGRGGRTKRKNRILKDHRRAENGFPPIYDPYGYFPRSRSHSRLKTNHSLITAVFFAAAFLQISPTPYFSQPTPRVRSAQIEVAQRPADHSIKNLFHYTDPSNVEGLQVAELERLLRKADKKRSGFPKGSDIRRDLTDIFVNLQVAYLELTGDFYGRQARYKT